MGSCTGTPKINKNVIISCNHSAILDKNMPNRDEADDLTDGRGSILREDPNGKDLKVDVYADKEPILIPILVKQKQKINLVVSGEWLLLNEIGYTNFKGSKEKMYNGANFGQLMCKVQGGKIMKVDKETFYFESDSTGQLLFFPNCDLEGIEPKGSLSIKIFGGVKETEQKEINNLTGYSTLPIYSKDEYSYITKEEFELFEMINKVRTNPKKFSELFLNKEDKSHKDLANFLERYSNVPPLTVNKDLTTAAYTHCKDLCEKGLSGHMDYEAKKNMSNQQDKKYFSYFGESYLFGKRKPLSIIIDLLLDKNIRDKKNRTNILNVNFKEIGLCIGKHKIYKWGCVILFNNTDNKAG